MKSREDLLNTVIEDWRNLKKVPVLLRDYEMCLAAVLQDKEALLIIYSRDDSRLDSIEYEDICLQAIKRDVESVYFINKNILNVAFYKEGIRQNSQLLFHIDTSTISQEEYHELQLLAHEQALTELLIEIVDNKDHEMFEKLINIKQEDVIRIFNSNDNLSNHKNASFFLPLLNKNSKQMITKFINILSDVQDSLDALNEAIDYSNKINSLAKEDKNHLFDLMSIEYQLIFKMDGIRKYFSKEIALRAIDTLDDMIKDKNFSAFIIVNLVYPSTLGMGMNYIHGLLTCAQKYVRNSLSHSGNTSFQPTIIKFFEFDTYLQFIKSNASGLEIRERFCLEGGHWRSGDIQSQSDKTEILLMDSIGLDEKDKYNTKELIATTQNIFNITFYLDKTKRQHSGKDCSYYALDDVMHLVSIENYLKEGNLFSYFRHQNKAPESIYYNGKYYKIIPVDLPLGLLRNMQYARFKKSIIASRGDEQHLPVNKKGQTAVKTVTYKPDPVTNRMFNKRIDDKAYKMARHNLIYLTAHPLEEIVKDMHKHTLQGFKERFIAQYKLEFLKSATAEPVAEERKGLRPKNK